MKVDREISAVMRRGAWINKQSVRKSNEAGLIVGTAMAVGGLMLIITLILN